MALVVALLLGSYLLGTFPTATIVGRKAGRDVEREGSGNPGASNVYRLAGAKAASVVFAGDAVKGALAAGLGQALTGERRLAMAAGILAIGGHCFPVTRRFRGGKGVATAFGVLVVTETLVAVVGAPAWLLLAKVTKRASVASLVIAVGMPVAVALTGRPAWEVASVAAIAVFIVVRHAPNLSRLARGQETTLDEP
ncbi:MAG TPA: glycerol-3-phosphate 1-O-acyltransferase PlsY [Acidimicrobiales bacterium]|nr:glycerol-3-phosphate 1-O-acyltransferase PlsY [Acidimicrobiales bacterium]